MTELAENSSKGTNWKKIFTLLGFLILGIIGLVYYNKYKELLLANQVAFDAKLKDKEKTIEGLERIARAQSAQLETYKPYKAIVRSAALRDSIYKLLPFKFGETVYIMPDSTKAVINSISINGNATDYSIKYLVRTKKGELQTVSITDLGK